MKSVEEAVEYYWHKFRAGEIDLGGIRQELSDNPNYTQDEVTDVCRHISQLDIDFTHEARSYKPFLDHILLNYFFVVFWTGAVLVLLKMKDGLLSHLNEYVIWTLLFGAIGLGVKNLVQIIQKHMNKE